MVEDSQQIKKTRLETGEKSKYRKTAKAKKMIWWRPGQSITKRYYKIITLDTKVTKYDDQKSEKIS